MVTCGAIFYRCLSARGAHSFAIKKTKGHAIAHKTYLIEHPHLRGEAQHNNIADIQADRARRLFYDDRHIQLSKVLVKCVDNHVKFVQAIHDIIYRVHVAFQLLRKAQAAVTPSLNSSADRWITHVLLDFQHDNTFVHLKSRYHRAR